MRRRGGVVEPSGAGVPPAGAAGVAEGAPGQAAEATHGTAAAAPTPRVIHRRLLAVSRPARLAVALAVGCGALAAVALVVQAWVVAEVVAGAAVDGRTAAAGLVGVLAGAVAVRALLAAAIELLGRHAAELAMGELRERIARRALAARAAGTSGARRGEVATAAVQGVDALAEYYARAVPQLALAAVVPVGVIAAIAWRQPVVGGLLAVTLPIVVVFMVLVGRRSAAHTAERQHALAVLGAHFLEVVRGLPTLRAHGRDRAQSATLRVVADRYRDESLGALRIAFLSALVLELLAMLGTAIAAAVVGVLLAEGRLDLATGLFVLLLAPEVYAPLRAAGQRFHAAEDGAHAGRRLLGFLDEPEPLRGDGDGATGGTGTTTPDPVHAEPVLDGAAVHGRDGRPDALPPTRLRVAPGRLVGVVGPSGAGKSTLLRLLARLQDPDAGAVRCGGHDLRARPAAAWWRTLAWLPQRPALPTGALADVLGPAGPALDVALRRADAAAVLAALPDGAATPVGVGGRPLSAGQAQRLALAGALASAEPLLLLDEPTAHLDPESAARVAEGLRAAAGPRTIVVATHDPALIAACDDLLDLGAPPVGPRSVAVASTSPEPVGVLERGARTAGSRAAGMAGPDAGAARVAAVGVGGAPARGASPDPGADHRATARRAPALHAVALGVLSSGAGLAVLATSGWLVTRAAEQPPVLALLAAIVVVRALGLVRALARYAERLASHDLALRRLADERVRWYERLAVRVGAPGVPGAADLLTRFTSDVDVLQDRHLRVVLPAAVAAVTSVAVLVAVAVILPAAAVVVAVGLLAAGALVPALAWATARAAVRRQGPARAALAAGLTEALEHGPQIAVAGRGAERLRALHGAARALRRTGGRQAAAAAIGQGGAALAAGLTLLAVLVVGARATAEGAIEPVWFGALVLLAVGAFDAPGALPEAATRLVGVQASRERLRDVVAGPPVVAEPAVPRTLPVGGALHAHGLVHRPGGAGTPAVLDGVDLDVAPGERVAIVGPSGTGKTTLAQLLCRLADPDTGVVSLGGIPLAAATGGDVRARVRLAGQDAHLLATSLRENVRVGAPGAGDGALRGALRAAGLDAWLAGLPAGLDTLVGEDGLAVSGGQRQRIGLARALASPAGVLVLDEPTAMLDAATARAVLRDAVAATPGRSLVVVTHDRDGLDGFDRVLELRDGALREVPAPALVA